MKNYEVSIRATITKTIIVEAANETSAETIAHETFSTDNDGPEHYSQETLGKIAEVEE